MKSTAKKDLKQIAKKITYRSSERMHNFRTLAIAERSAVFNSLSRRVRQDILAKLSTEEIVVLLDRLDLRRTHYILGHMKNERKRERVVKLLKNQLHSQVEHFLRFHPKATTSLIHLNYVFLSESTTIEEAGIIIEDHLHSTGKVPEVLVSRSGNLVGEVSHGSLVRESNSSTLGEHIKNIKTCFFNSSPKEVISLFSSEPHKKVVILDTDGSVIGVVYSDDIIELFEDSPASTLYSFAGVEESERPFDDSLSKVSHRYRWLILNLSTAFLAAGVVTYFEYTLTEVVLLAAYMPIVAGMGGNAATQTLAVMVRGITIGEITLKNSGPAIAREVLAGLINGIITGSLVAITATLLNQDPMLGLVVGLAVVFSMVVAGFAGTVVPLVMKHFGKDPATSATIFITTATDVLGFLALLGLATLLLI